MKIVEDDNDVGAECGRGGFLTFRLSTPFFLSQFSNPSEILSDFDLGSMDLPYREKSSFFKRRSLEILIGLNYISMDLIVPLKVIVMAWVGVFLHTQVIKIILEFSCFIALEVEDGAWVKVSLAAPNLYVFIFSSVDARDWVLENGPWHIQNKPLILRKWEPNMSKLDFDLVCMLVWVQLYNVPLELYNKIGLSYIASALGVPLYMDSVTANRERLEYAKVCVEIGACSVLPKFIDVLLRDGRIHHVRVVVPWLLPSCSKCKVFGHAVKPCSMQEPSHVWKQKVPVSAMKPGESSIQGASLSEVQEVSRLVAQVAGHVDSGGWLRLIKGSCDGYLQVAGVGSADGLVLENDVVGSEGVTAVEQGDGRVVVAAIVLSHVLDSRQIARENVHSKTEDDVEFPSLQASV
ncbi:hypothetical protein V6N13_005972 [Hibiscus sabdariffa]